VLKKFWFQCFNSSIILFISRIQWIIDAINHISIEVIKQN
jgi:hypothetical protein